jgi:hypothetical protein
MLTLTRQAAGAAAAGLLITGSSAGAAVLYDNGPLNGTIVSYEISNGVAVSDSFTLASSSIITGIDFGAWTLTGATVSTVDWGITETPNSFTGFIASGTMVNVTTDGPPTANSATTDTSVDSFSTGAVALGAGVYYLVLQNAVASDGGPVGWDDNNGPSTAFSSWINGSIKDFIGPGSNSESFQVLGSPSGGAVPEPASWVLMLVGLGGIGATVRRARGALVPA